MDTRRLNAFARVIDIGSITRAAKVLHIAQPALSQQIAALEAQFGKPLLVRSKRGVVPTEAGKILYRYCQTIQKQLDQAMLDIRHSGEALSGSVTVVFAPLSLGTALAADLLLEVRERHPGISLYVNEAIGGGIISEQIMSGRVDMALIFNPGNLPSLSMQPVRSEELYLVDWVQDSEVSESASEEVMLSDAVTLPLVLPSPVHTMRQVIDMSLTRADLRADIVAETESIAVLTGVLQSGHAATILPLSPARSMQRRLKGIRARRIYKPNMKVDMAICTSAQLPMSEPAEAVHAILDRLTSAFADRV